MPGILYLLPSLMGETKINDVLPEKNCAVIKSLKTFIVEDLRSARRFIKKVDKSIDINALQFLILNEHTPAVEYATLLNPLLKGEDIGIMSDAGCPGVADPGADVVSLAHASNISVVPLVGPSSILLSVMASGLNGQNFAFVGYLPVKPKEKQMRLKELEKRIFSENQTQVFIEAPYRNMKMVRDLLNICPLDLHLCIAVDVTTEKEWIKTMPIAEWRKYNIPDLHKRPAIFLIGK